MVQQGSLLDLAAARTDRETVEVLLERPGVRVERIVSTGQTTPPGQWYDQPGDEWVALLAGRATLRFEDGAPVELAPGDWLLIPGRVRHRVEATSADPPCVWLAVHADPAGAA
ncbi:MAG: cupin domain-containing protein [Candidatus Methylomirabilia bacterium]